LFLLKKIILAWIMLILISMKHLNLWVMELTMNNVKKLVCFVILFVVPTLSFASTTTWSWDLSNAIQADDYGTLSSSNGIDVADNSDLNADLSAFSDTGGSNDLKLQSGKIPKYAYKSDHSFAGYGMINQDEDSNQGSPEHAFDNETKESYVCQQGQHVRNGKCYKKRFFGKAKGNATLKVETDYDMAYVSFDTSVELNEVGFGWVNGSDTDFTVLAYTGSNDSDPTLQGNTWAGINSDWTLIGSYRAERAGYYGVNTGNQSSKHWLVGAFNPILDTTGYGDRDDTDAFKIKGLKGKKSVKAVPEPAALGIMLLGIFGLCVSRRKA
jgi:hypothetical protein